LARVPVTAHVNGRSSIDLVLDAGIDCIEHGIYLTSEQARRAKQQGVHFVPTMTGYQENADPKWNRGAAWTQRYGVLWSHHQESVRNALEAGLLIATGTDTLGEVAAEVSLLAGLGMSHMECIRAATINGAIVSGSEAELGSLESGKLADFAVLDGNPLDDLLALRRVCSTVIGGKEFFAEQLDALIPESRFFAPGW